MSEAFTFAGMLVVGRWRPNGTLMILFGQTESKQTKKTKMKSKHIY